MRKTSGVDHLIAAVQHLSMARSVDEVVDVVRCAARQMTGCDGAPFILRDEDKCYYVDEDAISPLWSGQRFPLDECISGWAMLNREPAIIEDIYADARIPHDAYRPTFVTSLAMVPIREADPIGAIGNYWAETHLATDEEVALLQSLANATSVALENVSLHAELTETKHRAYTDELTGLLSRRGFAVSAQATLDAARKAGVNSVLFFIDVDGLKLANDIHGHAVGDDLIRATADALRANVRDSDLVARMGGDEFCILVIDTELSGAELKARMNADLDFRGAAASIGYVEIGPHSQLPVVQLIDLADDRMYADKQERKAGR